MLRLKYIIDDTEVYTEGSEMPYQMKKILQWLVIYLVIIIIL